LPVTLPRPRTASDLARNDAASRFRAHVVATLTAALAGRATLAGPPGASGATTGMEVRA
jgi:hypothetical protein